MSNNSSDEAVQRALEAALRIIGDHELQAKLRDEDGFREALNQLKLPETARPALLDIVNRIERLTRQTPPTDAGTDSVTPRSDIEKMLLESFVHIRWSFWISLVMSVVLFVVGLIFLGIAVIRSLSESAVSPATLTIAGLGIADFVLLFYTRPWQDISVNLSNSQQVKIIATSYLSGLSLLQQGKTEAFSLLEQLTKNSVGLLEEFTEERSSASTKASSSDES
jgi:hypothetical protein